MQHTANLAHPLMVLLSSFDKAKQNIKDGDKSVASVKTEVGELGDILSEAGLEADSFGKKLKEALDANSVDDIKAAIKEMSDAMQFDSVQDALNGDIFKTLFITSIQSFLKFHL
ncbi:hypothetical protein EF83_22715 [Bacillus subtilis]|nr:hypothetical protein EF83_22715 [Bacillus subtilis]